jgi:hypothetical protein
VNGQLENFTIIRVKKCVVHEVATRAAKKILFFYVEPIVPGSEVCSLYLVSNYK